MENIKLKGGQIYVTQDNTTVYQVLEGNVLVYLFPYVDGKIGRRQLLGEFKKDSKIPGFSCENELYGSWRLGLVALDKASVKAIENQVDEEIKLQFASSIGLRLFSIDDFEEQLTEKYNINIKSHYKIYKLEKENE